MRKAAAPSGRRFMPLNSENKLTIYIIIKKAENMKRLFFALALACLTLAVNAQHETLFNNARVVGGFGAPIVEMGLGNEMTTAVGGGGAGLPEPS